MMQIVDAIQIVLELATANILGIEQCGTPELEIQRKRQIEACYTVEDFAVNQFGDD